MPNLPQAAAELVLDDLGIETPADLLLLREMAWERGALVRELRLEGAEARLTICGRSAVISVSTSIRSPLRKRFSIAHELGHFELHRDRRPLSVCLSTDINDGRLMSETRLPEHEADAFASALLLPTRFFGALCRTEEPSFEHIEELANTFNTSLTATALRYLQFCTEPLAFVFTQDSFIRWYQGNTAFRDLGVHIEARNHLDPSTWAANYFRGKSVPRQIRQARAAAWFAPGHYHPDALVQEQSRVMTYYNAVLTLIWVDEDIEDFESYF